MCVLPGGGCFSVSVLLQAGVFQCPLELTGTCCCREGSLVSCSPVFLLSALGFFLAYGNVLLVKMCR